MHEADKYLPFGAHNVLGVILGGGRGTRLFPLTKDRAKPAVPVAGKYRLVDIPISNCINSGFVRIFLLTQFNSASLHAHVSRSYKFDHFSGGFVEILAAEQTLGDAGWYQGTADAVRKNMVHFQNNPFEYMLVLSGDQLYRMDYRTILGHHIRSQADITVATLPVARKVVPGFGIMRVDEHDRITGFVEKPQEARLQDEFRLPRQSFGRLRIQSDEDVFLASMGIYVFNRAALWEVLAQEDPDFGKNVIPKALSTRRVQAFVFHGAWEDIGTIRNFFDCNLELARPLSRFNLFDMTAPVFTRPRFLPSSRISGGHIEHSLVSDGCIIDYASITHSVLGVRSLVGSGTRLHRTIVMGNDSYETEESVRRQEENGLPPIGIGRECSIEEAIIDKNSRVGNGCVIAPRGRPDQDNELFYLRDGVVIIPKGAVIPSGTRV